MKLSDVVRQLDAFDNGQTIFIDRRSELTSDSICVVAWMGDGDSIPVEASGMKVSLDVIHAKEVIAGKARQKGITLTDSSKVALLLEYI